MSRNEKGDGLKKNFVIDTNFFISVCSREPTRFIPISNSCKNQGFHLFTTDFCMNELNWYIKRTIKDHIEVISVDRKELDLFSDFLDQALRSIPQKPDLSLILAAKTVSNATIVSSDYKLIETINTIESNELDGIVSSVFLLELQELESGILKREIKRIRDLVYEDEVRYSIQREKEYDPLLRIKLIEDQSLKVIKSLSSTSKLIEIKEDKTINLAEGKFLVDFVVENLRKHIPRFFQDLKLERYDELLRELEDILNELNSQLILLNLSIDQKAYQILIDEISQDMVFIFYLMAIAYLYKGELEDINKAAKSIDKSITLLLLSPQASKELKVLVHLIRIILLLLTAEFEKAELYFSLFQGKLQEWGFKEELNSSEGVYISLVALRDYEYKIDYKLLENPTTITIFLIDFANTFFSTGQHENSWKIFDQALNIAKSHALKDLIYFILQKMLLIYFLNEKRFSGYKSKIKDIKEFFKKKKWSVRNINKIINEVEGKRRNLRMYLTGGKRISIPKLHIHLHDWMDVLKRSVVKEKDLLICRNWRASCNVGILAKHGIIPEIVGHGDKIKLRKGSCLVELPQKDLEKQISLLIIPHPNSEVLYRGGQGFQCLQMDIPKLD